MTTFFQYRRLGQQIRRQVDSEGIDQIQGIQRSTSTLTIISPRQGTNGKNLTGNDGDTSTESAKKEEYVLLVNFASINDPECPLNWPHSRKYLYTMIIGSTGFLFSGASAFDSEIVPQVMQQFRVGEEVALLGTTLYMVALGLGSMISAPFSETVGRQVVYIVCLTGFALFETGAGLSPNIQSWLICRFFAGFFGSVPLTTFGGSMSDMWTPLQRTYIFPVVSCLIFVGPFLAPMVADFIATSSYVSWRWTEWTTVIFAGTIMILFITFVPETHAPTILSWKAHHLRVITKNDRYHTSQESLFRTTLGSRLRLSIWRPIKILLTEPIVDLFSLYLVIVYIILFGFLPGFDFIYGATGIYDLDQTHTGLTFIPINLGFLLALIPIAPIYTRFKRKLAEAHAHGESRVAPEERLVFAIIGAPLLPVSIFWMGWTAWPGVSKWSSLVASVVFGFAVEMIFISIYAYIIDSYEQFAASALVGLTVTRYCASGPMVIVSVPMYRHLGVHWTLTLLGCLALVMTPVPYIFYRSGPKIRSLSRSAASKGSDEV